MPAEGPCPEQAQLRSLLDAALPSAGQMRLTAHLETCADCQQQLETMSAQDELYPAMARQLGRGPPYLEPKLQEALDKLKVTDGSRDPAPKPEDADDLSLNFLSPSEVPGQLGRIGHYAVLEVVGRGGMGVVLKAFDEQLQRVVAVKVMAPQLAANATARKRFTREAQATAAIRDEQVISIHAVGETNRVPYLVMDFIQGVSLQDRLDQTGPFALEQVVRIGLQIARGLLAAHAQGLIHRDIKPANILLENGVERVKITDFGLARALDDASLTQSGVIAGTPHYMAPEQARGEPADHRADLFSLGSVLYAMCAGHPPFRADGSLAVLKRVCEHTPRPLREINSETPNWLAAVIGKLHAKDPAERFQSAREVAELLGQRLAGMQQPLPPPMALALQSAAVPPAFVKAHFGRRLLATAIALLLVGGLAISEATGVTQVLPKVIRIFTPEGTLVVKVNREEANSGKPLTRELEREHAQKQLKEAERFTKLGEPLRASNPGQAEVQFRQALPIYEELLRVSPESANGKDALATCRWNLATVLNFQAVNLVHSRTALSDTEAKRAVALAIEAVALLPSDDGLVTTLGLAHYRAKDWGAALKALEKSEKTSLTSPGDVHAGNSRFVLALVHWQRGEKERARGAYDQAAAWMDKHRPTDRQLMGLRAEAKELLGVSSSP